MEAVLTSCGCGETGVRIARRTQARFCGDSAVDSLAKFKPKTKASQSAATKGSGAAQTSAAASAAQQAERLQELQFDLPPLEQDYEIDPNVDMSLGFGSGLKRYVHKKTRMPRAVLSLPKAAIPKTVTAEQVSRQLELLCKLDHPNIVPFRECCEDARHLRLVYEWCSGGLFITQLPRYAGMLTEGHIAQVIRELLSALNSAHVFGVHHLDLGLFSLFLQYGDRLSPIKVFGIGLAGFLMPAVTMRRFSKSNKHYYASPELFLSGVVGSMPNNQRHACDIWSVGAVLYTLCAGRPPFGAGSLRTVSQNVQGSVLEFGLEFMEYSLSLKDILEQFMKRPWLKRPSATVMLKHGWVTNTRTLQLKDGKISQLAMKQLNTFAEEDHVKQTVARLLTDIGLTIKAYKGLEDMFAEMDLNGDGTLTLGELVEICTKMPGMTQDQVEKIVQKLDRNGNCNVDISEFVAALVLEQGELDERLIKKAFAKMDKNGDARVNKKELFTVLRQYSGSLETQQVSNFVGKNDDDGDQKIDYREFMGLFPQLRDKYDEIDKRMATAKSQIGRASRDIESFRATLKPWLDKLSQHKDKMELACGMQTLEAHQSAGLNYSYERGQISEFEVQVLIKDILTTLKNLPGRNLTKLQRKARSDKKEQREEALAAKHNKTMVGLTILTTAATANGMGTNDGGKQAAAAADSGNESGSASEGEVARRLETKSASATWKKLVEKDRKEKQQDETWNPDHYLQDYMYWVMKVKSDFQWQLPLVNVLQELRDICVEEIIEVHAHSRQDLARLQGIMSETYVVREDTKYYDIKLPRNAHVLPMGSFAGRNLKSSVWWEKIEDLRIPATFVFGWAKSDVTHQKIEAMKEKHMEKLAWVGKYCQTLLDSIEGFFQEVTEDFTMSGTFESLMPCPPHLSHLYLKHCEGRELAEDAVTPRSDDILESDEEDGVNLGSAAGLDSSAAYTGVSQSMNDKSLKSLNDKSFGDTALEGIGGDQTVSVLGRGRRKRLERNAVLTQAHAAAQSKAKAKAEGK